MRAHLSQVIQAAGGWIPFDRFMHEALYAPGLGYYSRGERILGTGLPGAPASDFVTAPELSPLFGRCLARQIEQALRLTGTRDIWEFGAGTGRLAHDILQSLEDPSLSETALREGPLGGVRYHIVDVSSGLRQMQVQTLGAFSACVHWHRELPDALRGIVIGNELLDALPVKLIARQPNLAWFERGVALAAVDGGNALTWSDRVSASALPLPDEIQTLGEGSVTEIHPQAEAWVRAIAQRLEAGALFLIDYGFPAHEYYLDQRRNGTLMCHAAHQSDPDPLQRPGEKDITAHINFSGIADAALQGGMELLGYTSQANALINSGFDFATLEGDRRALNLASRLVADHEMGELFKWIGFCPANTYFDALAFANGDRSHRL